MIVGQLRNVVSRASEDSPAVAHVGHPQVGAVQHGYEKRGT